jgi:CRISPR-associated endonuclease/helicase Cas3
LEKVTIEAARVHDWGKATSGFQRMLEEDAEQILRHEILSAILARRAGLPVEVVAVVVGHHQKFHREFWSPAAVDCRVFASTLGLGADYVLDQRMANRELHELLDELELWAESLSADDRRFIALCRLLLISADGAASARQSDAARFLSDSLAHGLEQEDYDALIRSRYPSGFTARPFQVRASRAGRSVLVIAGCGTGKSAAAYLWAREHGKKRLFFCFPTTGTATEHWLDYARDLGALVHSRVEVDHALLGRDAAEGVELWSTPLIVCTVDTVLGLCAWAKKAAYGFPALLESSFVFDEVHSYDRVLFGRLLAFLELFPEAPVLLASASLPRPRLEALKRARPDLDLVEGPRDLEDLPRYEPPGVEGQADRVLVVRNTVDRAVASWCGEGVLYHSRFRYCDRVRIHRKAIDSFKTGACRLTATQVAEMSLDLSAGLLDTDEAPVPAMIQRMGRLNRWGEGTGLWIVRHVDNALSYLPVDLEQTRLWIVKLDSYSRRLSQSDLIRAWEDVGHCAEECRPLEVLTHPVEVQPAPTREDGTTIPVLLEDDAAAVPEDWRKRKVYLRAREVPIPFRRVVTMWREIDSVPVAPPEAIEYDELTGAAWRSNT